ncbi:MAG: EMC3/TMCO1 family protein [Candidatus Micrarchaeia archaeon]
MSLLPDGWMGVSLVALAFALVSFYVNRTFGNRARVKEIQKQVNDFNAEIKKATESGDAKKVERLNEREKELSGLMMEMMKLSFKPLIVILPLFWIAYSFLLPVLFPASFIVYLPFNVPSSVAFWAPWKDYLGYRGVFIYTLFLASLSLEFVFTNILKKDKF